MKILVACLLMIISALSMNRGHDTIAMGLAYAAGLIAGWGAREEYLRIKKGLSC